MQDLPTVLVVEDDHLIQSVVEGTLKDGGFDIDIASSGEQAIELLDRAGGKYRALVTDINLGRDKMEGWEIARHAREIDPTFPVVYRGREGLGQHDAVGNALGSPVAGAIAAHFGYSTKNSQGRRSRSDGNGSSCYVLASDRYVRADPVGITHAVPGQQQPFRDTQHCDDCCIRICIGELWTQLESGMTCRTTVRFGAG